MYQRKCRANREERLNIKFMTGCFTARWFLPHNTSLPMAGELELDLPEGPFQPNPFCDNIWVKLYNFHYWQFLVVPLMLELAVNTSQPPTRNKWEVMPLGTQKYLTSENTLFVTQNFYCWVLKVPPDSPSNSYRPPLEPCHVFKIYFLAHFIPCNSLLVWCCCLQGHFSIWITPASRFCTLDWQWEMQISYCRVHAEEKVTNSWLNYHHLHLFILFCQ